MRLIDCDKIFELFKFGVVLKIKDVLEFFVDVEDDLKCEYGERWKNDILKLFIS